MGNISMVAAIVEFSGYRTVTKS